MGIVGFSGNRDAHDYEHSPIPITIEVSHSFSVRPCSHLSMDYTEIPKVSTGLQQTYSDGGTRISIPLQTAKGKNRCNKKNLIRLTIFPLMQYVYANGMRRTTQQKAVQYAGICWMQNAGVSPATTSPSYEPVVFFRKRLPLSSRRTCRFAQIGAFMAFCQCTHIFFVRLCLLISHWSNTYSGKYAFSVGSAASCCAWSTKALKVFGAICRR